MLRLSPARKDSTSPPSAGEYRPLASLDRRFCIARTPNTACRPATTYQLDSIGRLEPRGISVDIIMNSHSASEKTIVVSRQSGTNVDSREPVICLGERNDDGRESVDPEGYPEQRRNRR